MNKLIYLMKEKMEEWMTLNECRALFKMQNINFRKSGMRHRKQKSDMNENDTAVSTFLSLFLFSPLLSIRSSYPFFLSFAGHLIWKGTFLGKILAGADLG